MSQEVITNELLCFVFNKLDVMLTPSIQVLCLDTYQDAAIEEAKAILKEQCTKNNAFGTFRCVDRKGDQRKIKNMEDVMKMAHLLGEKAPIFVAKDLSNLPPVRADNIDICSLLTKIERIETELKFTKELCIKVSDLQNCNTLSAAQGEAPISETIDAMNGMIETDRTAQDKRSSDSGKRTKNANWGATSTNPGARPEHRNEREQESIKPVNATKAPITKKTATFAEKVKSTSYPRRKSTPTKGTLETDNEVAVEKTVAIFTRYWKPTMTETDVESIVKQKWDGIAIKCSPVETQASNYKCFKVEFTSNQLDNIFSPSYWPKGIEFRRYRERSVNHKPVGKKVSDNASKKGNNRSY